MRIDKNGWLVAENNEQVKHYPTVRTMPLTVSKPLGIVWHWTAGKGGPDFAENLARSAQGYRRGIDSPASWHVLISKTGVVFQSAPFNVGTWHVGVAGAVAGQHFDNINHATIGCELENAGGLKKISGLWYCWPYSGAQCVIDNGRVAEVAGVGGFDAFPEAQVESAINLLRALAPVFGWTRETSSYGHVDFDPKRREDPGALFKRVHLPRILDTVFGASNLASAVQAP